MARDWGATSGWLIAGSIVGAAFVFARRAPARYNLREKIVLITGGSRGLGLLLASEFMERGARVAICARDEEKLEKLASGGELPAGRFLTCPCDLNDEDQVYATVRRVAETLGPIDVLVNNAGTIQVGAIESQRREDFEEAMNSNFWSAVNATLAVLPGMQARKSGRIVNVTSIGGKIAVPHLLPYSASKFALVGFSKGLRAELAKDGIVVTTVVPGLMRTGSPRDAEFKGKHMAEYGWFILSDSLPGVSMDARKAAERIVDACVAGKGEVVLGLPAQVAAILEAVAPNLVEPLLAATNRWILPSPGPGVRPSKGLESETPLTQSGLTSLTREAERNNNQL
jgi:short-subunit dehydrogenase